MIEHIRIPAVLVAAWACLGGVARSADNEARESAMHEQELTGLIVSLASEVLFDRGAVERQLGVILRKQLPPAGDSGEDIGWMNYRIDADARSDFFRQIGYSADVIAGKDPAAPRVTDQVHLDLRIRDDLCFSGEELVREYFKGSFDDFTAAQSSVGSEVAYPLQINGMKVSIRFRPGRECLKDVYFARKASDR
jgi:hypothetical protein